MEGNKQIIKKIFIELISDSISSANPLKVAYLGPEGTYTHIAMLSLFGESVDSVAMKTIPDIFCEVETGKVPFGIVPIENSTEELGYSGRRMLSGAGHDAQLMAGVCPAAMIFIPSQGGISHSIEEYSKDEDCIAGTNVLLNTVLRLSNPE